MTKIDPAARAALEAEMQLARRIKSIYAEAYSDLDRKMQDFTSRHAAKDAILRKQLAAGEITKDDYKRWQSGQVFQGKQWRAKVDQMSRTMVNADKMARDIINKKSPEIFAEGANYQSYKLEHEIGLDMGFGLYNKEAVIRLIRDEPQLLPEKMLDEAKDAAWTNKNISRQVAQGIIQGESLFQVADRMQRVANISREFAVSSARTAMTAAQNAGRQESLKEAEDMGINVKKRWVATLDNHTRHAHAILDGQKAPIDKPFRYGNVPINYPGDPEAPASLTQNCRCTMVGDLVDYPQEANATRYDNIEGKPIKSMTYRQWKEAKGETNKEKFKVVDGKNIVDTWTRRKDKFAFEIEDIINAQGYDGLPKIVGEQDFNRAVKESKFVAQRTYSAPTKEVLDEYRNQLYHGKWYVDCSTGGAQYGQGMYCAASWDGKINDGILSEMNHYISINKDRGNPFSKIETLTLAPDAKVITYNELCDKLASRRENALHRNKKAFIRSEIDKLGLRGQEADDAESIILGQLGIGAVNFDAVVEAMGRLEQSGNYSKAFNIVVDIRSNPERFKESMEGVYDFDDIGSYAVALGYDAINAEGHGASGSYTVILNRTKLIIKKPD